MTQGKVDIQTGVKVWLNRHQVHAMELSGSPVRLSVFIMSRAHNVSIMEGWLRGLT